MDLALFAIRAVVGLLMMGHGAQKLFGSFGGHGLEGTGQFFESLGIRPGRRHATLAGASEFAGGALLALGLLTPLGAAAIIGVMVVAILTVHAPKGPWVTEGGYEYNLVLITAAFAIAAAGPGGWSLDHALGLNTGGEGWGVAALAAGILGGIGLLISTRGGTRPGAVATAGDPATAPRTAAPAEPRFDRDGERERPPVIRRG
jgi:putative oxidoreductase